VKTPGNLFRQQQTPAAGTKTGVQQQEKERGEPDWYQDLGGESSIGKQVDKGQTAAAPQNVRGGHIDPVFILKKKKEGGLGREVNPYLSKKKVPEEKSKKTFLL